MTASRTEPDFPLPPYTHIPGVTPHPTGDPRGHSFGATHVTCPPPGWFDLPQSERFQRGRQLFNAGYYWEAHEVWEGVWIAAGRTGLVAEFVKGLIKLAAAGVKLRQGSLSGARRHLARAEELLLLTRSRLVEHSLDGLDSASAGTSTVPFSSEKPGFNVEQPLALVNGLKRELPGVPEPNAGRPVSLLGQL